jgi:hypothetical protein
MGREVVTTAEWGGRRAEVKALLEGTEIILRGEIKARIARDSISAIKVDNDELSLKAGKERLLLELGAKEAAKWADVLSKPPPSLAEKLGVSPSKPAFVMGTVIDTELKSALKGSTVAKIAEASCVIAVVRSGNELKSAFKTAAAMPALSLWCVYPKGRFDAEVRTFMRGQGYVDSKSCAVSADLTATRYGKRK